MSARWRLETNAFARSGRGCYTSRPETRGRVPGAMTALRRFARAVPCEDPADLCVVGDSGAPALLAEDAGDAARWGDDSVAYLTGGRLVVRPVGPGHPRVVAWSGVPPRPRQLTVFPGATEPR